MSVQLWLPRKDVGVPSPEGFVPAANDPNGAWGKPARGTGLWTSTYADGTCGWLEWMRSDWESELQQIQAAWLLRPEPNLGIWEIGSYEELAMLVGQYELEEKAEWMREVRPDGVPYGTTIDFERMAADNWAGIHLTDEGQCATRLAHPLSLYGWDCESTLWLRWCFEHVEPLPLERLDRTPYRYDDQEGEAT